MFYELLTGDVPMGRFDPPSKRVQVDVRLDDLVLRALEQEPDRRYQQVSEMKTKVQSISGMSPEALQGVVRALGREYKSKATLFGLPLLHVATGIDPKTGRKRVAKGIVALGDVAVGVFAAGGVAMGGLTFGGLSLGLISIGGLVLGLLLAVGGLAIAGAAFGGMACGVVAIGGGAVGYYALGGGAWGVHVASSTHTDPQARLFFEGWGENWPKWLTLIGVFTPFGMALVGLLIWLALRSGSATSGWDEDAAGPRDDQRQFKQRHFKRPAESRSGDQSGFVCAIIALVLFVIGLIVPVILLGVLPPNRTVVAGFTFVAAMLLAVVFGLIGHHYRMGRYTAVASLLIVVLVPVAWSFLAIAPQPEQTIEEGKQLTPAPVQTRDSRPVGGVRGPLDSDPRARSLLQIGRGLLNYHDTFTSFPPHPAARFDNNGRPLLSWRVHLLPFIEQTRLVWYMANRERSSVDGDYLHQPHGGICWKHAPPIPHRRTRQPDARSRTSRRRQGESALDVPSEADVANAGIALD